MHDTKTYSVEWGGKTLTIETGKLAGLASGSALVHYGETSVLATVAMSSYVRDEVSYFPLMVDYEENLYSAGKIKGSRFVKREGRPSDEAILNARITDRSLRPLFDERIRNDIQVIVNVLSFDGENDPAFLGLIAASTALSISEIPFNGPVAAVTVALVNGAYVLNPTIQQKQDAEMFLFMAVRDDQIVMIEADGSEATEDATYESFAFGVEQVQPVIALIKTIQAEVGKEKVEPIVDTPTPEEQAVHDAVKAKVNEYFGTTIESVFGIAGKQERNEKEDEVKEGALAIFETEEEKKIAGKVYEEYYEEAFRNLILEKDLRVDGRKLDEVRELYSEVDILKRTHGSALFQRGETQVLSTVTLGSPGDGQIIDGIKEEYTKRYMHHYNFPPFSVGEVRPLRGPSRRDIGHGALAEKALEPMIPSKEEFPYTIRVVSEVLMSNGSSSQGSACGSSLALMAAGVPIKHPVAGIAMGLVMTDDKKTYKILTDIQGVEDHSGDMDFKIAGTKNGITAIQLDIKLGGITLEICKDTLEQAKKARLGILDVMLAAIPEPRKELSPYAPRIETIMVNPELIGDIIGPGGKIINGIIDETGVQIDIEDDGSVFITSTNQEGMDKAKAMITAIVREIQPGEVYEGEVIQIMKDRNRGNEIGAIVDLGGGKDGMVHISELCHGHVASVSAVVNIGDKIKVVVKEVDNEKGRINLSRKQLIEPGADDPLCVKAVSERPDSGGDYHNRGSRPPYAGHHGAGGKKPYNKE